MSAQHTCGAQKTTSDVSPQALSKLLFSCYDKIPQQKQLERQRAYSGRCSRRMIQALMAGKTCQPAGKAWWQSQAPCFSQCIHTQSLNTKRDQTIKHQGLPPVASSFLHLKIPQPSQTALPATDDVTNHVSYEEHFTMKPQQAPSTFLFEIRSLSSLEHHHIAQNRWFRSSPGPTCLHLPSGLC